MGTLQLDALLSRLDQEYGVPISLERDSHESAGWIASDDPGLVRMDKDGALVLLAKNAWTLNRAMEEWPEIQFLEVRER